MFLVIFYKSVCFEKQNESRLAAKEAIWNRNGNLQDWAARSENFLVIIII